MRATVGSAETGIRWLRASRSYNPQAPEHEQYTEVHYEYDALGRRYNKRSVRPTPDGPSQTLKTTWYGWDGDRLVTTQTTTKTTTQTDELIDERTSSTLYEPNSFVPMIRIDKTDQKTRKADGTQEEQTHQSKAFYHCNHLGTPLVLIDVETAKVIWQAECDPWGLVKSQYNPHNMDQPIRMQGQQRDQETGLFYTRYRYYVPQVGRYVTQDPVGLVGGPNKYSYVVGNPTRFSDPKGLDFQEAIIGLGRVSPAGVPQAYRIQQDAYEFGQTMHKSFGGIHNGPADALRHCYWMCRMSKAFGANIARVIGIEHKNTGDRASPPQVAGERAMDLANNEAGLTCSTQQGSCSDSCISVYNKGKLSGLGGIPMPPPLSQNIPSDPSYYVLPTY
ncbi:RHS domain-containing protein [Curvibacter sp. RS43]|uniref:RHS repeat-associated core domain-containing protein n=1 Tax=Curvibacter microcysteis TaxID=3026419 RepID=UPI002360D5FD|nr:RHS repeat-associated core domain-containing protein [Curvibacter sp. RS43]MDD0808731.1 RHS domain-containing protein [Curvibacter sp. RS43]